MRLTAERLLDKNVGVKIKGEIGSTALKVQLPRSHGAYECREELQFLLTLCCYFLCAAPGFVDAETDFNGRPEVSFLLQPILPWGKGSC